MPRQDDTLVHVHQHRYELDQIDRMSARKRDYASFRKSKREENNQQAAQFRLNISDTFFKPSEETRAVKSSTTNQKPIIHPRYKNFPNYTRQTDRCSASQLPKEVYLSTSGSSSMEKVRKNVENKYVDVLIGLGIPRLTAEKALSETNCDVNQALLILNKNTNQHSSS